MTLKFLSGTSLNGKNVSIQATKLGVTTPAVTVGDWGNVATPQALSLESTYTTAWTGDGVMFRAYSDAADYGIEDDYLWDFDDTGATYENYDANHLIPNSRNVAYGPFVGHAWETAGTKTVTVQRRDSSGDLTTSTTTVVVSEPTAAEFTKVLYVSFANNFTGAPAETGNIQHISNISELRTEADAVSCWILFRRGETFDLQSGNDKDGIRAGETMLWTAWGTGTDPLIQMTRANSTRSDQTGLFISNQFDISRFSFQNIKFFGGYDPLANPGSTIEGAFDTTYQRMRGIIATTLTGPLRASCFRVSVDGVQHAFDPTDSNFYLGDTNITNWQNYGAALFGGNRSYIIDGGIIKQMDGVLSQDDNNDLETDIADPNHSPVRIGPCSFGTGFYNVSMRARGGWFDNGGSGKTEQPCIRITNGPDNTDRRIAAFGCLLDGGREQIAYSRTNSTDDINVAGRMLVDSCDFSGTSWTRRNVVADFGGVTVRNCRAIQPNVVGEFENYTGLLELEAKTANITDEAYDVPINVYNNTAVNLVSGSTDLVALRERGTGGNPTERNNLLVCSGDVSLTDYTPLSAEYVPQTGSAALGAATGFVPYRDIKVDVRPATKDIGAYQVST